MSSMSSTVTGIKVDIREFTKALNEYAKSSKRDNAYILTKVAGDVAFQTAKNIPIAEKESILAMESKPWWVKYISALLSQKGFRQSKTIKSKVKGKYVRTFRVRAGKFTRKQARQVSKKILQARAKGRGLLKSAWVSAALAIKSGWDVGEGLLIGSSKMKRAKGRAYKATPSNLNAIIQAIYDLQDDGKVVTAEQRIMPHLQAAMNYKSKDMRDYIAKKQAELAAKYNGVGK